MMSKFTENYLDTYIYVDIEIQIRYLGGELQQRNLNGQNQRSGEDIELDQFYLMVSTLGVFFFNL